MKKSMFDKKKKKNSEKVVTWITFWTFNAYEILFNIAWAVFLETTQLWHKKGSGKYINLRVSCVKSLSMFDNSDLQHML